MKLVDEFEEAVREHVFIGTLEQGTEAGAREADRIIEKYERTRKRLEDHILVLKKQAKR